MRLSEMIGHREPLSTRRGRITLGGGLIWADIWVRSGWRVQQHALNGEFRLLDPRNRVRAKGSAERCIEDGRRLAQPATSGHAVILLHGLGRTRRRMARLAGALSQEGYTIANVGYPSLLGPLDRHAEQLHRLIDGLDGSVNRVSFVTHSLGGLVLRACLAEPALWTQRIALGRAVMIAPPNRGAALAAALDQVPLYTRFAGPCGAAVLPSNTENLPPPSCPFGVIAGGTGTAGFNPLLDGDDDGIVRVAETRLTGEADFLRVRATHGTIAQHPATVAATIAFLHTGRFDTTARRAPGTARDAMPAVMSATAPIQGDVT